MEHVLRLPLEEFGMAVLNGVEPPEGFLVANGIEDWIWDKETRTLTVRLKPEPKTIDVQISVDLPREEGELG